MSLIKILLKNKSGNYVIISQVINACIGIIAGKFIAIYVLPDEFGEYNIQFATFTFFSTLLISPFLQFLKATNKSLLPRLGTKMFLNILIPLLLIMSICLLVFTYLYLKEIDLTLFVILLLYTLFLVMYSGVLDYLNVNNSLIEFSKMSVLKSLSGLLFLIGVFLFGANFVSSIETLWLMQLIGVICATIFFFKSYTIYKSRFKVGYKSFYRKYFRFAWPLMIMSFWAWINNYFDRYAIEYFMETNQVGIYNANYGLGSKFFLLISPVFMVMITPKIYSVLKLDVKKTTIIKYAKYYALTGVFVLSIIFVFRNLIGNLLLSDSYSEGFFLIFWIALAFFIITLTYLFESIFYALHKTNIILKGNIISAIFNVVLNIVLIPNFGLTGAFLATLLSFSIHFIYINMKFYKL